MSKRSRLRYQNRVLLPALVAAGPAWLLVAVLLWYSDEPVGLRWTLFAFVSVFFLIGLAAVRQRVVQPLRSLANMLEALREGDYSMRGRNIDPYDSMGEVMVEVNSLGRTLQDQRLEALEAGALLQKVIADVDIAVFGFDSHLRLRLVNRAGEALLGGTAEELRGRRAAELGLERMISEPSGRIVTHVFPGGSGRWEVRRRSFREGGKPSELLVISDLSRALREEERQAWQRLVRVIGHELNSSLAPIKSMAGTLRKLIRREPAPADWRDDANSGLTIIHDRAESLERFMGAYARLARLPPPTRRDTDFARARRPRRVAASGPCDDRRRARRPAVDRPRSDRAGADQPTAQRRRGGGRARRRARRVAQRGGSTGRRGRRRRPRVSRAPTTCGCRSLRPSPAARASASCCRARSSRTTAARSRSRIERASRVHRAREPAARCDAPAGCA